ncbi:MAG: hypothetical protein J6K89_05310, partial [Oscillospiraceae bacterium]|nr:hypothetical protein [Oscillospiraceae bacterium]
MKRFLALFLVCCMVLGLMPAVAFAQEAPADPLTDADYVLADLMWEAVNQKEQEMHSKRSPVSKTVDALVNTVTSSPYYAEGSLIRNGDFIVWETIDGIPCGYSPSLFNRTRDAKPMEGYDPATAETELTVSFHTKGGTPGNRDVFIIQPYYGIDSSFTDQYNTEGEAIAQALGGSCTTYRTTAASIDKIADAIESGAVVVFDSHGDTDYYGSNEDYTSKANTSYICLQTNSGLTSADYELANGEFGDYYHAYYAGLNGSMRYYCVDGTAISNHMEKNSANGLLWMAICLGMATDGLQAPLRAKGVEVAYGYSQSVTFDYDYEWETVFWDEMMMGATVSEAIAKMKDEVGLWDWCHATDYDTIAEAREMDCAFPIVVSSEDKYPGHGNVDDLQTVYSTWTLMSDCSHSSVSYIPAMAASCTTDGNIAYYLCDSCNAIFTDEACTNRINISSTVISALGHSYDNGVVTTQATCGTAGILTYTCSRCKSSYTESIDPLGHNYVDGACANCGQAKPDVVPFTIGASGTYIIAANVKGTYYAMSNVFPTNSNKINGTIISITDDFVDEAFATDYAVTLNYDSIANTYTIESNGSYLKYPSSTNLTASSTPYSWTITQGENGSWRILSQTSNRALIFRANGYSLFGGYYLPNANAGNSEYFDMEIIPVGTSGTDSPVPGCPHENTTQAMVPASCETEGRLTLTCDDCGAVINDQILPASGHSWVEGELITAPTCVKEGVRAYSCSSCGASKTEVVAALGHQWNDGELTTAPS